MAVPRQIIVDLVATDQAPDLAVRFDGLDLANYSTIDMKIQYEDGSKKSKTVTPDGTDEELGTVAWASGDLVEGRHQAEFKLVQTADSKPVRLPQKYPVILNVRKNIG